MKSNLSTFFLLWLMLLVSKYRNIWQVQGWKIFFICSLHMFADCKIFACTYEPFELIWVMNWRSLFCIWLSRFFQIHLLKRLFFLPPILLILNSLYTCGSPSAFFFSIDLCLLFPSTKMSCSLSFIISVEVRNGEFWNLINFT